MEEKPKENQEHPANKRGLFKNNIGKSVRSLIMISLSFPFQGENALIKMQNTMIQGKGQIMGFLIVDGNILKLVMMSTYYWEHIKTLEEYTSKQQLYGL